LAGAREDTVFARITLLAVYNASLYFLIVLKILPSKLYFYPDILLKTK